MKKTIQSLFTLIALMYNMQFIFCNSYSSYNFENNIQRYMGESTDDYAVLLQRNIVEFIDEPNGLLEYNTKHIIAIVNSDEKIEENNKIYLWHSPTSIIMSPKARIVKPNGDIQVLNESSILSSVNEETGDHYQYFALEGLEKGSVVEYFYTVRKAPAYTGVRQFVQDEFPVRKYECTIKAPNYLWFDFKVFNDTNTFVKDALDSLNNSWNLTLDSIPALQNEFLSPYNEIRKKYIYKLDRNTAQGTYDISSYGQASKNIYNSIYGEISKKEEKEIDKIIDKSMANKIKGLREKVMAVENYIKNNIQIVDYGLNDHESISQIISSKIATEDGVTRLYANVFRALGVECELVVTSDNFTERFDSVYESYHFLYEYLIYINQIDEYICPKRFEYRLGLIPVNNSGNYGLFIKEKKLGSFKTGVGEIKFIKPEPYTKNYQNLVVSTEISDDFEYADINLKNAMSGYYMMGYQPYWQFLDENQKKSIIKENIDGLYENVDIIEWNVQNGSSELIGEKPFVINAKLKANTLIERAGNKYLFKVGNLIGPQAELYNEKKRTQPVFDIHKRSYKREISIKIPDNYSIKNVEDLVIDESYIENNKTIMQFKSDFKLENDILTISINEYYDRTYHTVGQYEIYRRVINAAADFNKIALVITEK